MDVSTAHRMTAGHTVRRVPKSTPPVCCLSSKPPAAHHCRHHTAVTHAPKTGHDGLTLVTNFFQDCWASFISSSCEISLFLFLMPFSSRFFFSISCVVNGVENGVRAVIGALGNQCAIVLQLLRYIESPRQNDTSGPLPFPYQSGGSVATPGWGLALQSLRAFQHSSH
jgi:hypothetical protein